MLFCEFVLILSSVASYEYVPNINDEHPSGYSSNQVSITEPRYVRNFGKHKYFLTFILVKQVSFKFGRLKSSYFSYLKKKKSGITIHWKYFEDMTFFFIWQRRELIWYTTWKWKHDNNVRFRYGFRILSWRCIDYCRE